MSSSFRRTIAPAKWFDLSNAFRIPMTTAKQRPLCEVNGLECDEFVALLGNVVEHAPLCAAAVWGCRPFRNVDHLQASFTDFLEQLSQQGKEGVLRLYPDLAGHMSLSGEITAESKRERAAAHLDRISDGDRKKMMELNGRYKEKFGFPFVICARENKVEAILKGFERRLENSTLEEAVAGVNEVKKICYLRIKDLVVDSVSANNSNL